MCSNYDSVTQTERLRLHFAVDAPPGIQGQVWPLYRAPFIRRHPHRNVGDEAVPPQEACAGLFGLIPHWAAEASFGKRTYNARSETVAEKPSFRDAWRLGQRCIVPAEHIYEPDWRSGRAVPTRIQRADHKPMGIAGLWATNRKATGEAVLSFTMLTLHAGHHPVFSQLHRPEDEKRMVAILREDQYDAWLDATPSQAMAFMQPYPAESLLAVPAPERGRRQA